MKNNKKSCDIASITAKKLKINTPTKVYLFLISYFYYIISPSSCQERRKNNEITNFKK